MWKQWLTVVLGLGVIATPFTGMTGDALTWTLAVTGIVIAGLAAWSAMETTPARESERRYQAQVQ